MTELRTRIDQLEKTLYDYIERDKVRLLEQQEVLREELRVSRSVITKMQKELRKSEERRKTIAETAKQILESE